MRKPTIECGCANCTLKRKVMRSDTYLMVPFDDNKKKKQKVKK